MWVIGNRNVDTTKPTELPPLFNQCNDSSLYDLLLAYYSGTSTGHVVYTCVFKGTYFTYGTTTTVSCFLVTVQVDAKNVNVRRTTTVILVVAFFFTGIMSSKKFKLKNDEFSIENNSQNENRSNKNLIKQLILVIASL